MFVQFIFPIGIRKKVFVEKLKAWTKSTSYEVNHNFKVYLEIRQKFKAVYCNEGNNYNPIKHSELHYYIKNGDIKLMT